MQNPIKVTDQQVKDAEIAGYTKKKPAKPKGSKKKNSDKRNPVTTKQKEDYIEKRYNPWAKEVLKHAPAGAKIRKEEAKIKEAYSEL